MRAAMAVAAAMTAAVAAAQEAPRVPPQLEAVVACSRESDDARRLACFDRAVAAFAEATAKGDVKVLDREEVQRTRRSLFGFALPRLPFFTGGDGKSAVDQPDEQIEAIARSASSEGYGRWTIVLEDGAVWRTTEAPRRDPKAGAKITIRRGTMGGYFLKIDGGTAVRALRVG